MKKILKNALTLLCSMALVIGFVGGTTQEADAASKKIYTGKVYVSAKMPSWTGGEITLSYGNKTAKSGWLAPTKSTTATISGQASSGTSAKIYVTAKTNDGTFNTSFTVKAADLPKNKKFTVKFKTSGIGAFKKVTGISVS